MKTRLYGLVLALCLLVGCASINVMNTPGKPITAYKMAYVQMLPVDEFNLGTAIIREMTEMGFHVVAAPAPVNPLPTDMKVEYTYLTGWDMTKLLKSFRIIFSDTQTGVVLATLSYKAGGLVFSKYHPQARIQETFEEFRERLKAQ